MKERNTHNQLHPASKFPSFLLSFCLNQFTNLPWHFPYPTSHFMLFCFKKVPFLLFSFLPIFCISYTTHSLIVTALWFCLCFYVGLLKPFSV